MVDPLLNTRLNRRHALRAFGGLGVAALVTACADDGTEPRPEAPGSASNTSLPRSSTPSTAVATPTSVFANDYSATTGQQIPFETAGPFPADGSNGPNVLTELDVVRRDITRSFAGNSGQAAGLPVALSLRIVDVSSGEPLAGSAVYLWHCTADGRYSIYEIGDQNYLRGVQVADETGVVTFDTIFPGCYGGRWPHCHFEVFDSLDVATSGRVARQTSQLALPEVACREVYANGLYGNSSSNLDRLSLSRDMVFRDGWDDQLATVDLERSTVDLLVRV